MESKRKRSKKSDREAEKENQWKKRAKFLEEKLRRQKKKRRKTQRVGDIRDRRWEVHLRRTVSITIFPLCKNGSWDTSKRSEIINFLKLQAAFFGLKCLANQLRNTDMLLRIDNTTAISYNRMGVQIVRLNRIIQEIWQWCEARDIVLFASYISSKDKFTADAESRRVEPETE